MKLQKDESNIISVCDMEDGEIGEIVQSTCGVQDGKLVQRYGNTLVQLQKSSGHGWSSIPSSLKVRILQKGEVLIIE